MVTISCQKCQKVFTHEYLSKAQEQLRSHLKRKNPCDSKEYKIERKTTEYVPNMEEIDISGVVECLDPNIRYIHVASRIFKHLLDQNKFAVWPNTKLNEIWFKENDMTMTSTPSLFLLHYWYNVFQKRIVPILERDWPQFHKYKMEIIQGNGRWDFIRTEPYKIHVGMMNAFLKSDMYKDLKSAICGHLKQVPRAERTQIRINFSAPKIEPPWN
jgi:hypothetical protein